MATKNKSKQEILHSIQLANAMAGQEILLEDTVSATNTQTSESEDEQIERFCQRLSDYGVIVHRCHADELTEKIRQSIEAMEAKIL